MKVFVTGATGFLGRRLVRQLLGQGHEVRCLVRPSSDLRALEDGLAAEHHERLRIYRGRFNDAGPACKGCDVVFHLAAALSGATASLFLDNVIGTRRLIEQVGRSSAKRFVLVSSLGIYGTGHLRAGDVLDERCPLDPNPHLRDGYSFSKIAQEKVTWQAHQMGAVQLVVVRPGVIYGPGRDCLSNRVGLRLGRFLLKMGGRQRLPYTYVDNCADALCLAGSVAGIEGEAFNIVDNACPTAHELLGRYRSEVEPLHVLPVPYGLISPVSRLCECYHRWSQGQLPAVLTPYKSAAQWKPLRYANGKAKAVLGWKPRTDFTEGLRQTFQWRSPAARGQLART